MKGYVMDAFSQRIFGGNQAGVVPVEQELEPALMRQIAAELKHSETAFVKVLEDGSVSLRYFTPACEVELCGHATVASFALLRKLGKIGDGALIARTKAGDLRIDVEGETVWMDMAPPRLIRVMEQEEWAALYEAYGLTLSHRPEGFVPKLISTGLADILLPVRDHEALMAAVQNESAVTALSRRYDCVGVHMFCPGEGEYTAFCSNFAPLYDIPEECATGTSNGALTYYLYLQGILPPGQESCFLQGEHMNRPSQIRSRLLEKDGQVAVRIGGSAVMSLSFELMVSPTGAS